MRIMFIIDIIIISTLWMNTYPTVSIYCIFTCIYLYIFIYLNKHHVSEYIIHFGDLMAMAINQPTTAGQQELLDSCDYTTLGANAVNQGFWRQERPVHPPPHVTEWRLMGFSRQLLGWYRVLQKKQPPTHTRSKGAVRAPLPPTQCWAQRVYTTAFKKNNHFSNRGLPL